LDDETPPPASQTTQSRGGKGKPKAREVKPSKATIKTPKKSSPSKKVSGSSAKKDAASSGKKRKREESDQEDDYEDSDEGFEVVGKIVQAPTKGRGMSSVYWFNGTVLSMGGVSSASWADFSEYVGLFGQAQESQI
jgi:hypothetical protein